MTGISTVHSAPSAGHNGTVRRMAAHSTMKAPPLITIRKNQILMPGDSATIQVDLPDQKVITESLKNTTSAYSLCVHSSKKKKKIYPSNC